MIYTAEARYETKYGIFILTEAEFSDDGELEWARTNYEPTDAERMEAKWWEDLLRGSEGV
jgi:hypothetical protein